MADGAARPAHNDAVTAHSVRIESERRGMMALLFFVPWGWLVRDAA
jgi:hypothetical protein